MKIQGKVPKSMINEFLCVLKKRQKVNLAVVFINLALFIAVSATGGYTRPSPIMAEGVMFPPFVFANGEYYRLFTSMFLHFDAEHVLFNMLLLFFAGDMLEERFGKIRYLLVYLIGGLSGNLLSFAVEFFGSGADYAVSAGASGAVFAVIGALVWIVLFDRTRAEGIDKKGLFAMAVLSLVQGFFETGVDEFAHLGGFIGGFLLAALLGIVSFQKTNRKD